MIDLSIKFNILLSNKDDYKKNTMQLKDEI